MRTLLTTLVTLSLPTAAFAQPTYTLRDLGDLGGGLSLAYAISNSGLIVGYAFDQDGNQRAVLWRDGGIEDLGTLGGRNSSAFDVNEIGEIVGTSDTPQRATNAFVIRNGAMIDLGRVPGDSGSNAQAINELGHVAANSIAIDRPLAFLFDNQDEIPTFLGSLGIPETWVWDVNDSSVAVGWSTDDQFRRFAFRWENGSMVSLGSLIGLDGSSDARAVNNAGDIVGCSSSHEGQRAFLYRNGVMRDLGVLPNGIESCAQAVNELTQVVGYSFVDPGFQAAPFLWQAGRMYDLNSLTPDLPAGARLFDVLDINDRGQIVGQMVFEDTTYHGFVLTPLVQVSDPIPGIAGQENSFVVTGAAPGSLVTLFYSEQQGTTALPECSGRFGQLRSPRVAGSSIADGSGRAEIRLLVPLAAADRNILIQAFDQDFCEVSNLRGITFSR